MNESLRWIMVHLAGSDWATMNLHQGDGFYINIPLSIFFTVVITLMLNAIIWIIKLCFVQSSWRDGYDAGYTDGLYSKACKLSKIKFNHDDNVILVVTERSEVEQEKQEALKHHD